MFGDALLMYLLLDNRLCSHCFDAKKHLHSTAAHFLDTFAHFVLIPYREYDPHEGDQSLGDDDERLRAEPQLEVLRPRPRRFWGWKFKFI